MKLRRNITSWLCCLMLFYFPVNSSSAQSNFTSRFWHVTDGLPSEVVQALAQTPDHYLWIGTTGGLLRFDGNSFVLFDRNNTPALKADSIFFLTVTRDGSLWIGSEGGGLTRYLHGTFRNYGGSDGLTNNVVRAVQEDSQGALWVGTDDGLFVMRGDHLHRVDNRGDIPAVAVHVITRDREGRLWVGGTLLLRIDRGRATVFQINGRADTVHIKTILQRRDGTIWVGTVSGLYRLTAQGVFMPVAGINRTVRILRETKDGILWIGTIGDGMYTLAPGTDRPVPFLNALANKAILNIFEDIEGNIWVATQAGLERLSRTPVNIIPIPDAADSDFGSIFRDTDGTIWMCSTHLERLQNGKFERYELPGLKGLTVRNLMRDRDGVLWVGTEGNGLFRLASTTKNYTTRNGLPSDYIRAMLQARDGSLWVGTDNGASHITAGGISNVYFPGHVPSVMALLEDHAGDIWLGGFSGLMRLHNGKPVQDDLTAAIGGKTVWSLHQSSDGTIWAGTNDGLFLEHDSHVQHITEANGLPFSFIYEILEGTDGRIWLSGPSGVVSFMHSQLERVEAEHFANVPLMFFDVSGDFEPAELFNSIQPAGIITLAGDVWFPSSRGAVHIQSNAATHSEPFPLKIDRIVVDGRQLPPQNTVRMSSTDSRLEIDYAPILLSSQDTVLYRIKLEGFDKGWQDVTTQRAAYFTNLPSGHYTFRVEAFRVGNVANAQEAALTIVKAAPFYESAWFILLCLLTICAFVYGIHRLRMSRVKLRFQAVVEERSRVAREMHDTVIQGCTTISALLEASASMDATDQDSARELNYLARKQIEATILEARQAVWNLRRGTAIEDDIESAIAKIAQDAGDEFGVTVHVTQFGEPFPIISSVAHELLMVIREAVHNSLVHGKPTEASIDTVFSEDHIAITIKDNGIGFDILTDMPSSPGHFGLQGMYERMNRIGAQLIIDSAPGRGSVVKVFATAASCRDDCALERM